MSSYYHPIEPLLAWRPVGGASPLPSYVALVLSLCFKIRQPALGPALALDRSAEVAEVLKDLLAYSSRRNFVLTVVTSLPFFTVWVVSAASTSSCVPSAEINMSFVKNLLAPGGGVALIPFIRYTIGCLLLVCMAAFVSGVARIHMAILSFLSGGLLVSLSFFQSEYEKMQRSRGGAGCWQKGAGRLGSLGNVTNRNLSLWRAEVGWRLLKETFEIYDDSQQKIDCAHWDGN